MIEKLSVVASASPWEKRAARAINALIDAASRPVQRKADYFIVRYNAGVIGAKELAEDSAKAIEAVHGVPTIVIPEELKLEPIPPGKETTIDKISSWPDVLASCRQLVEDKVTPPTSDPEEHTTREQRLRAEADDLRQRLAAYEKKHAEALRDISRLQTELVDERKRLQATQRDYNRNVDLLAQVERDRDELTTRNDRQTKTIQDYRTKLIDRRAVADQLRGRVQELERAVVDAKNETATATARAVDLGTRLKIAETNVGQLMAQRDGVVDERDRLHAKLRNYDRFHHMPSLELAGKLTAAEMARDVAQMEAAALRSEVVSLRRAVEEATAKPMTKGVFLPVGDVKTISTQDVYDPGTGEVIGRQFVVYATTPPTEDIDAGAETGQDGPPDVNGNHVQGATDAAPGPDSEASPGTAPGQ